MDPGAATPGPPPPPSGNDPTEHPTSPPLPPPPHQQQLQPSSSSSTSQQQPSRYESQKRRDWSTFLQYLKNHKPPLTLDRCSGAHVIEFLKYMDQFGKTKVHNQACEYFGQENPPVPCPCPLKQAWGSLDALIGRLRAAYEESGGKPESNPFGARAVRIYLREVKENQGKARGNPYEKRKRKRATAETSSTSASASAPAASTATATAVTTKGEEEGRVAPPEGGDQSPTPPVSASS